MVVSLLIRRHQQVAAARIRNVRVAKVSTGPDRAQLRRSQQQTSKRTRNSVR